MNKNTEEQNKNLLLNASFDLNPRIKDINKSVQGNLSSILGSPSRNKINNSSLNISKKKIMNID